MKRLSLLIAALSLASLLPQALRAQQPPIGGIWQQVFMEADASGRPSLRVVPVWKVLGADGRFTVFAAVTEDGYGVITNKGSYVATSDSTYTERIERTNVDSTLVGVGSSICGGSAIAATAPVIDADDEEIAQAISVIFLFNVVAALVFPTLGGLLGLSNEGFGLFAGTAVNDTSSVTAAAAAWDGMHAGANTLDAATIVKLTRTLAIIPITLALALWQVRKARRASTSQDGGAVQVDGTFDLKRIFPFFIVFFVLASVITTVFALPAGITAPIKELSKFFIVMAMAAIGFNTNIVKLVRTGGKPIALGFACWVGIACVSLAAQHLLGIW